MADSTAPPNLPVDSATAAGDVQGGRRPRKVGRKVRRAYDPQAPKVIEAEKLAAEYFRRRRAALAADGIRATSNAWVKREVEFEGEVITVRVQELRLPDGGIEEPPILKDYRPKKQAVKAEFMSGMSTRDAEKAEMERGVEEPMSSPTRSRRFKDEGDRAVTELKQRKFHGDEYCAVMVDAVALGRRELEDGTEEEQEFPRSQHHRKVQHYSVVIATGVKTDGTKVVLGTAEGSSESAEVGESLLHHLVGNGLDPRLLWVTDGGKGTLAALRALARGRTVGGERFDLPCGTFALQVQRCRIHKGRNIEKHLPKKPAVRRRMMRDVNRAWMLRDPEEAKAAAEQLAENWKGRWPRAASAIREGLDDSLTIGRLGFYGITRRQLSTTNVAENLMRLLREKTSKVRRWNDLGQLRRWVAASLLTVEKNFGPINLVPSPTRKGKRRKLSRPMLADLKRLYATLHDPVFNLVPEVSVKPLYVDLSQPEKTNLVVAAMTDDPALVAPPIWWGSDAVQAKLGFPPLDGADGEPRRVHPEELRLALIGESSATPGTSLRAKTNIGGKGRDTFSGLTHVKIGIEIPDLVVALRAEADPAGQAAIDRAVTEAVQEAVRGIMAEVEFAATLAISATEPTDRSAATMGAECTIVAIDAAGEKLGTPWLKGLASPAAKEALAVQVVRERLGEKLGPALREREARLAAAASLERAEMSWHEAPASDEVREIDAPGPGSHATVQAAALPLPFDASPAPDDEPAGPDSASPRPTNGGTRERGVPDAEGQVAVQAAAPEPSPRPEPSPLYPSAPAPPAADLPDLFDTLPPPDLEPADPDPTPAFDPPRPRGSPREPPPRRDPVPAEALLRRPLDNLDIAAVQLVERSVEGKRVVVAAGLTGAGDRLILGFAAGDGRAGRLADGLLHHLVAERHLDPRVLWVVGSSPELRAAIESVSRGAEPLIQRCRDDLVRAVTEQLPLHLRDAAAREMNRSWAFPTADEAAAELERVRLALSEVAPVAAGVLRQGAPESLIVHGQGLSQPLRYLLGTTRSLSKAVGQMRLPKTGSERSEAELAGQCAQIEAMWAPVRGVDEIARLRDSFRARTPELGPMPDAPEAEAEGLAASPTVTPSFEPRLEPTQPPRVRRRLDDSLAKYRSALGPQRARGLQALALEAGDTVGGLDEQELRAGLASLADPFAGLDLEVAQRVAAIEHQVDRCERDWATARAEIDELKNLPPPSSTEERHGRNGLVLGAGLRAREAERVLEAAAEERARLRETGRDPDAWIAENGARAAAVIAHERALARKSLELHREESRAAGHADPLETFAHLLGHRAEEIAIRAEVYSSWMGSDREDPAWLDARLREVGSPLATIDERDARATLALEHEQAAFDASMREALAEARRLNQLPGSALSRHQARALRQGAAKDAEALSNLADLEQELFDTGRHLDCWMQEHSDDAARWVALVQRRRELGLEIGQPEPVQEHAEPVGAAIEPDF